MPLNKLPSVNDTKKVFSTTNTILTWVQTAALLEVPNPRNYRVILMKLGPPLVGGIGKVACNDDIDASHISTISRLGSLHSLLFSSWKESNLHFDGFGLVHHGNYQVRLLRDISLEHDAISTHMEKVTSQFL